jgi:glyoxylase-like metal-dependent hydrolase (beta-lactamase superfamily II)
MAKRAVVAVVGASLPAARRLAWAFALAATPPLAVAAQQRPPLTPAQQERVRIRPLMDGLYLLPGFDGNQSGGNVAVRVTPEGVIVVDDKFIDSFEFITDQVRRVTDLPIRYVLNTHHHFDHAGSNADFMRVAEVISHENARANIVRNGQTGPPRVVFRDQTAVFIGGAEVRMLHLGRGHTNGDAVVYFPDLRTVHTGDLLVWGDRLDGTALTPFWDVANGGSLVEWPATLTRLLELDFDRVIPGHGPVLGKEDVRAFRAKLETMIDRLRAAIASGATRDDIVSRIDASDLGWPLPEARILDAFDELSAAR